MELRTVMAAVIAVILIVIGAWFLLTKNDVIFKALMNWLDQVKVLVGIG